MLAILASVALQSGQLFPVRWFYMQTNLAVEANAQEVIHVMDRAHLAGYNGMVITDSKFGILDRVQPSYFEHAAKIRAKAKEFGIEIIPAVADMGWSSSLLAHNVNLIEGQPVKQAPFVVKGGTLQPVREVAYANGGMEATDGSRLQGFSFQDGPGTSTVIDSTVKHEGRQSIRFENFKLGNPGANARLMHGLAVRPWQQYRAKFWLKTEGVQNSGDIRCFAMGEGGKVLSFMDVGAKSTQDWTEHTIVFNSQDFSKLTLYIGIWGGVSGRFWVDDIRVEVAGFLNVLRRKGTPVKIETQDGKSLLEGKDFDEIKDPQLGQTPWPGEYTYSQASPAIKTSLPEGTKVLASFTHAITTELGKSAICPREPQTLDIVADQMKRIIDLWQPKTLFFAHDEIRVANQCPRCRETGLTPGQIYATNIKDLTAIVNTIQPKTKLYIWSDMFDPAHNAVDNYYLSNGSWKESWKGLTPEISVMNWNSGKAAESLPFFAKLGCHQVLSGYYDGPVNSIKSWLSTASSVSGIDGVMYTTWRNDYTNLEAFGQMAFRRP